MKQNFQAVLDQLAEYLKQLPDDASSDEELRRVQLANGQLQIQVKQAVDTSNRTQGELEALQKKYAETKASLDEDLKKLTTLATEMEAKQQLLLTWETEKQSWERTSADHAKTVDTLTSQMVQLTADSQKHRHGCKHWRPR